MNSCPNCGKENSAAASVCLCGELLRADVTNVQGWETETVFCPAEPISARSHWLTASAIALVVLTAILALAWPQIRERWATSKNETVLENTTNLTQKPSRSDITPIDDIVQNDPLINDNKDGVFDFSARSQNTASDRPRVSSVNSHMATVRVASAVPSSVDPYDAQLLDDQADASDSKSEADKPDCKPDVSVPLKKPELTKGDTATKLSESKGYVLGPRGGCFIVTPGGGKRYVDRSLCSSSAAAGSRQ
jgi:hypothetical protein